MVAPSSISAAAAPYLKAIAGARTVRRGRVEHHDEIAASAAWAPQPLGNSGKREIAPARELA
jgi:hypothetical protein